MDNGYETYNLIEIKKIISEATQLEMWDTRENQEKWEVILNMQTRLHDLFGIEEQLLNNSSNKKTEELKVKNVWILTNEQAERLREIQTRISAQVNLGLENPKGNYANLKAIQDLADEMEDILVNE